MISIKIRCQHCYLKIACGDDFKGSLISCPGCGEKIEIPTPHWNIGTQVDDFIIEQWLGNGNMGEVYLARQISMDRMIALKIMVKEKLNNEEGKQRFIREVRTLANLKHPNIVAAIKAGDHEGGAYLAMHYIDGMSVEDKITIEGHLDEELALTICETIADALEHAWEDCKLIHRDLKPSNFMIDRNNKIHLMDMGVAKRAEYDSTITALGIVMGTPWYMSPEQARGVTDLDLRSDIYSLGASLYHMITGKAPFSKYSGSGTVMNLKRSQSPEDPLKFNPDSSPAVVNLIRRLMARNIQSRPQTWQEVKSIIQTTRAERLAPKTASTPTDKKRSSGSYSKSDLNSSRRLLFITIMIIAILVMSGILIYYALK